MRVAVFLEQSVAFRVYFMIFFVFRHQIHPCTPEGKLLGEEATVLEPSELLGGRVDFMLQIKQVVGVRWVWCLILAYFPLVVSAFFLVTQRPPH